MICSPRHVDQPKSLPPVIRNFLCPCFDPTQTCCAPRPRCTGAHGAGQPAHRRFQNQMIHSNIQMTTTAHRPLQLSALEPWWVPSLLNFEGITLFLSLKAVSHRILFFIIIFYFHHSFLCWKCHFATLCPLHFPSLLHYNQRQLLFLQIIQTSA